MKGKLQLNNVVASDVKEKNQLKMLTLPEAHQLSSPTTSTFGCHGNIHVAVLVLASLC